MLAKYNANGTKKLQNVRKSPKKIRKIKLGSARSINKVRK
jgi:hypothetical protein